MIVVALCLSIGPHWALFQTVAWGKMVVEYSQEVPFVTALAETFDGDHPCDLCKDISAVRNSGNAKDAQLPVTTRLDLICATRTIVTLPRCVDFHFPKVEVHATLLAYSPPTPPPRSGLA